MLTLTVARGLLYGDGGEVIRVGRTLILGLCDSAKPESDVKFHPSKTTKKVF